MSENKEGSKLKEAISAVISAARISQGDVMALANLKKYLPQIVCVSALLLFVIIPISVILVMLTGVGAFFATIFSPFMEMEASIKNIAQNFEGIFLIGPILSKAVLGLLGAVYQAAIGITTVFSSSAATNTTFDYLDDANSNKPYLFYGSSEYSLPPAAEWENDVYNIPGEEKKEFITKEKNATTRNEDSLSDRFKNSQKIEDMATYSFKYKDNWIKVLNLALTKDWLLSKADDNEIYEKDLLDEYLNLNKKYLELVKNIDDNKDKISEINREIFDLLIKEDVIFYIEQNRESEYLNSIYSDYVLENVDMSVLSKTMYNINLMLLKAELSNSNIEYKEMICEPT